MLNTLHSLSSLFMLHRISPCPVTPCCCQGILCSILTS